MKINKLVKATVSQKWAKYQPKDGDIIMVCAHIPSIREGRWCMCASEIGEPLYVGFTRPDGTWGESAWICICDECWSRFPHPVDAINRDVIFSGDQPVIREG